MVSVLDLDFPTLLSSSLSDFSPSGSSDTDTFSSPTDTSTDFHFQDFTLDTVWDTTIPVWDTSTVPPESETPSPEPLVKLELDEDVVTSSPLLSPSRSEDEFIKPEPMTPTKTSSRKPRAKRRKVDSNKEVASPSPSSVTPEARLILSREELLTLTSSQYEDVIAQVRSVRELTAAEKRDVKRQRRLIKNRESAQASRQRKKNYVEELEKRLTDLSNENTLLRQNSVITQNENALLRAENEYIKGKQAMSTFLTFRYLGKFRTVQYTQPRAYWR